MHAHSNALEGMEFLERADSTSVPYYLLSALMNVDTKPVDNGRKRKAIKNYMRW